MAPIIYILTILQDVLMSINIVLALLYCIVIVFIRRFHHRNNMFILNICVAIICSAVYFIIYFTMYYFDLSRLYAPHMCIVLHYAYSISSAATPFAFVAYSVYRFCLIKYPGRQFFKTKRWVFTCIAGEWLVAALLSLPFVLRKAPYCPQTPWLRIYTYSIAAFLPLVINTALNLGIFLHVRSSTLRIQPQVTDTNAISGSHTQPKISHRDLSLLRQMVFMFLAFIIAWTPVFSILIPLSYGFDYLTIFYSLLVWGEFVLVIIVLNLFKCNHELRKYLLDRVRQFLGRQ